MKISLLLGALAPLYTLTSAFNGQVDYTRYGTNANPQIFLTDYNTGSRYQSGAVYLVNDVWSNVYFSQSVIGGYNFNARAKRTTTGCIHVDFQGGLDEGWMFCCGGTPCDLVDH